MRGRIRNAGNPGLRSSEVFPWQHYLPRFIGYNLSQDLISFQALWSQHPL